MFLAFPANAQPAILRIWPQAHKHLLYDNKVVVPTAFVFPYLHAKLKETNVAFTSEIVFTVPELKFLTLKFVFWKTILYSDVKCITGVNKNDITLW